MAIATALVLVPGAAYTLVALTFAAALVFFDDTGEPMSEIYLHWLLLFAPAALFAAAAATMFSAWPAARRLVVGLTLWSAAVLSTILLFTFWSETWSH